MKTSASLSLVFALAFAGTVAIAQETPQAEKALAVLHSSAGSQVKGTITFTKTAEGIRVEGEITGLTPGKHGFHIHEFGDTTSPDGKSAGGHFNPKGEHHGGPDAEHRHAGDFGNVEAGSDGTAKVSFVDKHLTFDGATSILGRGLVVHAKADDLKSQPSGEAGDRVAVGVIGVTKAK
jgi:Cu-Zn family superoxide dismutase